MHLTPKPSTLLPQDAREALIAASKVTPARERQRAIEAATERVQRKYPQLFKLNHEGESQ